MCTAMIVMKIMITLTILRPLTDDPSFLYKKLVRETWSKKLGYTSHTQNHPSFSYGKHGGRQRRRFSCSYKSVAIVFPALNDNITQLNSTQQTTYKKEKQKSLKSVSLQPWIAQYKWRVSCISIRIADHIPKQLKEFCCIWILWTCCHSIFCRWIAVFCAHILCLTLIWRYCKTQTSTSSKFAN